MVSLIWDRPVCGRLCESVLSGYVGNLTTNTSQYDVTKNLPIQNVMGSIIVCFRVTGKFHLRFNTCVADRDIKLPHRKVDSKISHGERWSNTLKVDLSHWPVMPYGNTDLRQHWLRKWLITRGHQAFTWANFDLSTMRPVPTKLRPISQKLFYISITTKWLKITYLKTLLCLPGANDLSHCIDEFEQHSGITSASAR